MPPGWHDSGTRFCCAVFRSQSVCLPLHQQLSLCHVLSLQRTQFVHRQTRILYHLYFCEESFVYCYPQQRTISTCYTEQTLPLMCRCSRTPLIERPAVQSRSFSRTAQYISESLNLFEMLKQSNTSSLLIIRTQSSKIYFILKYYHEAFSMFILLRLRLTLKIYSVQYL